MLHPDVFTYQMLKSTALMLSIVAFAFEALANPRPPTEILSLFPLTCYQTNFDLLTLLLPTLSTP